MITAGRTDIGRIRQLNEDRAIVLPERSGMAMAVIADGMGGHQAGETASQMAVDTIRERLELWLPEDRPEVMESTVREAIEIANERIFQYASEREQFHGMGTTVVVVVASRETLVIGHVGDSRAYLVNNETFRQLTEDHSLVNELVKSGQITQDEADRHPRRNVLTRALGTETKVAVDVHTFAWEDEDVLLLCSDGLSGYADKRDVVDVLRSDLKPHEKVDRLIELALAAGGEDNVTVVVMHNKPGTPEEQR